jgi:uncharacterized protein (TIGR00156 family)
MHLYATFAALSALSLVGACADSKPADPVLVDGAVAANPIVTDRERLTAARDGNWLTLSGQVVSTEPDNFMLQHGAGLITVEMDDWDWFQEGRSLKPGDRVTVSGRVDRDMLEAKKIEASTVYVQNLGTHFFANGSDEEDFVAVATYAPQSAESPAATGVVTAVEGREFVLGSGTADLRVDTAGMANNPLDDRGSPRVKVGDRVQVWGPLNVDPDERPEIAAEGLVVMSNDRTKRANGGAAKT